MTALSIAEAEPRATADPQVSGVRRRGIRAAGDLASVTELPGAARRKCEADPEISRRAGVSRTAGVSCRAVGPAPAGVSRARQPVPAGVSRRVAAPGRAAAAPVRLTSRGRAAVAGLVAAVAVCAGLLLAAGGAAAVSHGSPGAGYQGMRQVVVKPGQTLWSIASAAEPTADPQAVIQQILAANSLPVSTIHAGQVLWVPRG